MSQLWLVLSIYLGIALVLGYVWWLRWRLKRDGRRSPLAGRVANLPGEHCRQQIDKADEGITESFLLAAITPSIFLLVWTGRQMDWSSVRAGVFEAMLLLGFAVFMAYTLRKIGKHFLERRRWLQGMKAELATAHHLQALMAEGCIVLHDLPADGFNIDHVVVGPRAVFAVETKSRLKPAKKGKASARVAFDGHALRFPEHVETKPIEQARAQSRWLADYLAGAAGERVPVVPVLALPGWFVELSKEGSRADVLVVNPRNTRFPLKHGVGEAMPEHLRHRIVHGLMQRYPAME